MTAEARTPAQLWLLRLRLVNLMARRHRITLKLANWHVMQMTDGQVAEEWERYHTAKPENAEVTA